MKKNNKKTNKKISTRKKTKSLGKNQYIKSEVRKTKEWKQLRIDITDAYDNTDPITNKPLRTGFNVHHCDMRVENYANLDINRFRPLNRATHDLVHVLYRYYEKDPEIIDRLKQLLDDMVKYNND